MNLKTRKKKSKLNKQGKTQAQALERAFIHVGGADIASVKYPHLYQACVDSMQSPKSTSSAIDDDGKNVFESSGPITLAASPHGLTRLAAASDTDEKSYVTADLTCIDHNAVSVLVISEMRNKTTGATEATTTQMIEGSSLNTYLEKKSEDIAQYDNQELELITTFYRAQPDSETEVSALDTENYVLVNNSEMVHEFTVEDPRIHDTGYNYINVMYDRQPAEGEKADYIYKDVKHGDKVDTMLPVKGSYAFSAGIKPLRDDKSSVDNFALIYEDETIVENQIDTGSALLDHLTFEEDDDGIWSVNFDFGEDWHSQLDVSRYEPNNIKDVFLKCAFRVNCYIDGYGEIVLPVTINSSLTPPHNPDKYNFTRHGSDCIVPTLKIRWGCFHKDTKVKLADGSEKKISKVKAGEMLLTAEGKQAIVLDTYEGPEQTLIRIETNTGKVIKLTKTHPVLAEFGTTTANKLVITGKLHTEDGLEEITNITEEEYNDTVYNVDCSGAMLIANGVFAGDFVMQNNEAEGKRKPKAKPNAKAKAVIEDLKRMSEDFKKMHQQ